MEEAIGIRILWMDIEYISKNESARPFSRSQMLSSLALTGFPREICAIDSILPWVHTVSLDENTSD